MHNTTSLRRILISCIALLVFAAVYTPAQAHDFGGTTTGSGDSGDPENNRDGDSCSPSPGSPKAAGAGGIAVVGPSSSDPGTGGDPVYLFNGRHAQSQTDMVVNGLFPIAISRRYDSRSIYDSSLGYGWALNHDRRLYEFPDGSVTIRYACGSRDRFVFTGGAYVTPTGGRQGDLIGNPDGTFTYTRSDGSREFFDAQGRLTAVQDKYGHRHEYTYDPAGKLPLTGTSPFSVDPTTPMTVAYVYRLMRIDERAADGVLTGNYVTFAYDASTGRMSSVTSSDGRTVSYVHDATGGLTQGNLVQVNGLEGIVTTYLYEDTNDTHNLTSLQEEAGATPWVTSYDTQDRVSQQTHGNDTFTYNYVVDLTETIITHTIRDANGLNPYDVATTYYFDANGDVTRTRGALGNEIEYLRDAQGDMTTKNFYENEGTVAVPNLVLKRTITFGYDALSRRTAESVTLDTGETVTRSWTYDNGWLESEQVVSSADPGKLFRTEYTFYRDGQDVPTNIESIKRRKDGGTFQTTSFFYDAKNRLMETVSPDGQKIVNLYEAGSLYTTKRYYEIGAAESPFMRMRYAYDAQGNRNQEWDPNDNLTQYTYDDLGRQTKIINALGEETIYTYTGMRRTQIEVGHTVAGGEGQVTRRVYAPEGWLQSVQRKQDDGSWLTDTTYTYDSAGNKLSATDAESRTTQYEYDLLGRLTKTTDPKLKVTTVKYDMFGNRISDIDAKLNEVKYIYDDLDRLIRTELLGISPSAVTQYTYDAAGNRTSVVDPENHTTSYAFDTLSRNTAVTQPLGQTVQYFYDNRDRMDYKLNARGHKIDYDYEPWGAVNTVSYYPNASATTPDKIVAYTYHPMGEIQSVTDSTLPGFSYQYTYDAINRVDFETISGLGGSDKRLDRDYDRYGNRSTLALAEWEGGQWVEQYRYQYQYNKLNRLIVASLIDPQPLVLDYLANDDLTQIIYPGGVVTDYVYEFNGPPRQIKTSGSSGVIEQLDYMYDDARRIDTLTTLAGVHEYTYDGADRLTEATHPVGTGLPPQESFGYDRAGNREDPADPAVYNYDSNNRITNSLGLTYTFDDDGNETGRSDGAIFVYDKDNRVVQYTKSGTVAAYQYDPQGRRIMKTLNGVTTWYLWDRTSVVAEYNSTGSRARRYAYLPDTFVPTQMEDSNGVYDVHMDGLQTPRFLTDASEAKVWEIVYQAYGDAVFSEDPDGNGDPVVVDQRLPGQYYDAESGLYYNQARYYDPIIGRYVSADPIGLEAGVNLYAYALNNPINNIDPHGLQVPGSCHLQCNDICSLGGRVCGQLKSKTTGAAAELMCMSICTQQGACRAEACNFRKKDEGPFHITICQQCPGQPTEICDRLYWGI